MIVSDFWGDYSLIKFVNPIGSCFGRGSIISLSLIYGENLVLRPPDKSTFIKSVISFCVSFGVLVWFIQVISFTKGACALPQMQFPLWNK